MLLEQTVHHSYSAYTVGKLINSVLYGFTPDGISSFEVTNLQPCLDTSLVYDTDWLSVCVGGLYQPDSSKQQLKCGSRSHFMTGVCL